MTKDGHNIDFTSNTYSFLVVCYGLWLDSMIDVSIGTKIIPREILKDR